MHNPENPNLLSSLPYCNRRQIFNFNHSQVTFWHKIGWKIFLKVGKSGLIYSKSFPNKCNFHLVETNELISIQSEVICVPSSFTGTDHPKDPDKNILGYIDMDVGYECFRDNY